MSELDANSPRTHNDERPRTTLARQGVAAGDEGERGAGAGQQGAGLGLGGRAGNGKQYMSWIALDDLVGAVHHLLLTPGIEGPVNAVAPEPETNAAFSRTLGKVLRRPTVLPLPAPAIRMLLGEMGLSLLLEGVRVRPARLLSAGFPYLHPQLEGALRAEMGY